MNQLSPESERDRLRKYGVFLKRDSDGKWYVEQEEPEINLAQSDSA